MSSKFGRAMSKAISGLEKMPAGQIADRLRDPSTAKQLQRSGMSEEQINKVIVFLEANRPSGLALQSYLASDQLTK